MKVHTFWRTILVLFVLLLLIPSLLWAGPMESFFGASSRVQAMGGAGVAFSQDASATFYNPAHLARCPKQSISAGYLLVGTNLQVKEGNRTIPGKQLGLFPTGHIGACLSPLTSVGIGFYAASALQLPMQLPDIETLNSTPRFAMYDASVKSPSVMIGFGFAPIRQFSFGFSLMISGGVEIKQTMQMPDFASTVSPQLYPIVRLIAGVSAEPVEKVRLSLVFRQASYGQFGVQVDTKTNVLGGEFPLALTLGSLLSYSPSQLALGASYQVTPSFLVGADLSYYRWSSYVGPFMHASAKEDSFAANRLSFLQEEAPRFRDVFVPRFGFEYYLNKKTALRAGYAFLNSPAPIPSATANLLDNHVHRLTLGSGYQAVTSKNFALVIDGFVAVDIMLEQHVVKAARFPGPNNYVFGGSAMNMGLTLKAEY